MGKIILYHGSPDKEIKQLLDWEKTGMITEKAFI